MNCLALTISRARDLGFKLDIDRAHALTIARAFAGDLNFAAKLAAELADSIPGLARALAGDVDAAHTIAGGITRGLVADRDRARVLANDLRYALDRALNRAAALDRDITLDGTKDLVAVLSHTFGRVGSFGLALDGNFAAETALKTRVSRSAGWVVGLAAQMLSAAERPRWTEEFRSELYEIAASTSRRGQLVYALRLLRRCHEHRSALVRGKRRVTGQG